ncbi:MAG: hypothetical protein RL375_4236 [Pseudomonadota bacterium]|jgi:hypothetical protein
MTSRPGPWFVAGGPVVPTPCPARKSSALASLGCGLVAALLVSSALAQSRGELLYGSHCISCHTQQMHWRDNRTATDWPTLQVQVRRWQSEASLAWGEGDIVEVARFLNESIYCFEQTPVQLSWSTSTTGPGLRRPARAAPCPR